MGSRQSLTATTQHDITSTQDRDLIVVDHEGTVTITSEIKFQDNVFSDTRTSQDQSLDFKLEKEIKQEDCLHENKSSTPHVLEPVSYVVPSMFDRVIPNASQKDCNTLKPHEPEHKHATELPNAIAVEQKQDPAVVRLTLTTPLSKCKLLENSEQKVLASKTKKTRPTTRSFRQQKKDSHGNNRSMESKTRTVFHLTRSQNLKV